MRPRVLVAGIGNIFLGDDGFGVEVIKELARADLPPWVQIADYGIAGMHLAYDLMGGYDTTILLDATPHGRPPGTLSLIEADTEDLAASASIDAHGMQPDAVFRLLRLLGGDAGRVLVVGCEPACVDEGIGLSPPVEAAVPAAVRAVTELAWGTRPELPVEETTEVSG
ncbi:hydrogenase maturation protease [Amycolatopsis vancoresmycina]|uniref:Peptidase M52/hydrogen uptake protein n=1 Tax=Amycolatopsis vancoresmycina DSM 44592 TaxID=1292037 RepID=R1FWH7_9PSEU|nr:hydrogenase maturation protease [Amycolatopsis vancoresmycina]EOD63717.1 peptidase M52/hydrogen uptake protein [Amycolatopsis vancoresmycina DSM 44592]